ncbi:MAG: aspartate aminotransferase [Myxococcota bacterium]|jgi:aspartate aminotransferase
MSGIDVHQYFIGDAAQYISPVRCGIRTSEILRIAAEVRGLQRSGREVCNLTVGDFLPQHFPIPGEVSLRAQQAYRDGETNYPPPDGLLSLREGVAELYHRKLGLDYGPECVCIGSGARPPIFTTLMMLTEPGDVTVSFRPAWNIGHFADLFQTDHIFIKTTAENNFFPTVADVAATLGRARVLMMNTPLNPTGTAISAPVMQGIAQAIVDENRRRAVSGRLPVMLIFDHVYWMLTAAGIRHHHPVALVPECAPFVINIDAASKSFASTGLRVGWAVLPPVLQERMRTLMGHVGAWAPKPEQLAIAALLKDPAATDAYIKKMRAGIAARLDVLYDGIMALRGQGLPVDAIAPQGAIYLSFRVDMIGRGFTSNEEIRAWLLSEAGVAVVPFQAFDMPEESGWLRMSVGAVGVDELSGALQRLEAAIRSRL